jgi:NAD-dependent dihydropyrimidine dehydrogenase PreA subunit
MQPEAECLHENATTPVEVATFGHEDPIATHPSECLDCGKVLDR